MDAQKADQTTPHQNDGVEVFIDGDRVPNDFSTTTQVNATQTKVFPSEGFEPLADAAGHQFTRGRLLVMPTGRLRPSAPTMVISSRWRSRWL